jgi:hypothetical protein
MTDVNITISTAVVTVTPPDQAVINISNSGPQGAAGPTGPTGPQGTAGPAGPAGTGVPSGGAAGQILTKVSPTDYDTTWQTLDTSIVPQLLAVKAGVAMSKGSAVYITGATGGNIIVGLAQANAESTSSKTLGLIQTTLANNGQGYVVTHGVLSGLNTAGTNEGDTVWLSPSTPGGLVYGLANKPYAPNHMVFVGYVTRSHQNQGAIYVNPQNGFELEELHNVNIDHNTDLNTGDLLQYQSNGLWQNAPSSMLSFTQSQVGTASGWITNALAGKASTVSPTFSGTAVFGGAIDTALSAGYVKSDSSGFLSSSATIPQSDLGTLSIATSQINWSAISTWAASTSYAAGDLVQFSGVAYRRKTAGTSGSTFDASLWNQVTPVNLPLGAFHQSATSIDTIPRTSSIATLPALTSGNANYYFFTPVSTVTVTRLQFVVATVASGLTHAVAGLYTVDASDNLSLVIRTADNTNNTWFNALGITSAAAGSPGEFKFDAAGNSLTTYTLIAGQRYAIGLGMTGTTPPQFSGQISAASITSLAPRLAGANSGFSTALPTSVTSYATNLSSIPFVRLT